MNTLEIKNNGVTYQLYNYNGTIFKRTRDDSTGNYGIYKKEVQGDYSNKLKKTYTVEMVIYIM